MVPLSHGRWKNVFLGGGKYGEIVIYLLETKKTTFLPKM